jgi:hypothetical protein
MTVQDVRNKWYSQKPDLKDPSTSIEAGVCHDSLGFQTDLTSPKTNWYHWQCLAMSPAQTQPSLQQFLDSADLEGEGLQTSINWPKQSRVAFPKIDKFFMG